MYWTHFQVGSCDVKFPIRLEGLVLTHSQVCRYIWPHMNTVASLLTVCFFCWPFNDLLSVLQLRAWAVSWSHLQVPFLWTFLASLHWKSGLYLISSGWWSHVLSSSYLFPAKSSWLGPRLLKDHVVVLDVSLWVSGANRNLWSFWEYLPNPEELQKAVKVDSASQRAISILEFLSLYKSGSSLL